MKLHLQDDNLFHGSERSPSAVLACRSLIISGLILSVSSMEEEGEYTQRPEGQYCASSSQGNFGGRCMLYGQVNYTANLIGIHVSSSSSLCYFVSAISVMVAVVCFSLCLYWLYSFCMEGEVTR